MTRVIRRFLFWEAAAFGAAALVHFGLILRGYEHRGAGTAESVIAAVLFLALLWTWLRPRSIRWAGLVSQAFALFGTFVGLFTIAIGIGPRTGPDIAYHVGIIIVLVIGLIVTARAQRGRAAQQP